jgi:hypothetical protein
MRRVISLARGCRAAVLGGLLLWGGPLGLAAQPFVGWAVFTGDGAGHNGHLAVPDGPDLRPSAGLTLEAWVALSPLTAGGPCRSLLGKNLYAGYWMGVCPDASGSAILRSTMSGPSSALDGGGVPAGQWTHLAVTSDGVTRRHYINGEEVASAPEHGPLGASADPLWIGSDCGWDHSPTALLNEVRLWSVSRAAADLQATLNVPLADPLPGLVGLWRLADAADVIGLHPGTWSGTYALATPQPGGTCPGDGALCLWGRFVVTATWRIGGPTEGGATGVGVPAGCAQPGSGLFWFFSPANWELVVKAIDGCVLNRRWWIFSAAMTNVFYRLEVHDLADGAGRIYFNYPGPPAPAVTDTVALTCP